MIIDTHAHLYLKNFEEDRAEVVKRAKEMGISAVYLPNIDSTSVDDMLAMCEEFPGYAWPMMGLHPCSVKENYLDELKICRDYLEKMSFTAVGEIGIDLYWDKSLVDQQMEAFKTQIQWAEEFELPFVIHSRDSLDVTIQMVTELQKGQLTGVFHCFTGDLEQAKKIADLGFYMGIGGVVTFKNAGVAEVVRDIPLDQLVLETDSPYLSPVPYRGKRNESSYLDFIIQKIADIKHTEREEVIQRTTENAHRLFKVYSGQEKRQ